MLIKLKEFAKSVKIFFIQQHAKYKSKTTFPEKIDFDLSEVLSKRKIKIAIIDDKPFPWIDALVDSGYHVEYFDNYTKPTKNPTKKPSTYSFENFDIILCDILEVGSLIYPQSDGIGVIKKLRSDLPFHVIAAYTGNPGITVTKLQPHTVDAVFSKELDIEDFLLNLSYLANIFKNPKDRWRFLRERLQYLKVPEEYETKIRKAFVQQILLCQYLNKSRILSPLEIKKISLKIEKDIDLLDFVNYGITAGRLLSAMLPLISSKSE